jgi:hypothetical protein
MGYEMSKPNLRAALEEDLKAFDSIFILKKIRIKD